MLGARRFAMQPQIVLLREGVDDSQGVGQVLANIDACLAVGDVVQTTLGPRGADKLLVGENGATTLTNDGATVLERLDIVHPAARILTDISQAQDRECGDGTTTVAVLSCELLRGARALVASNVNVSAIISGFEQALSASARILAEMARPTPPAELRDMLVSLCGTCLSSKLLGLSHADVRGIVSDATVRGGDDPDIAVLTVASGSADDVTLIRGTAFRKTFAYAGFEQQPKQLKDARVLCLRTELELKPERDNAEIRVASAAEFQRVVDAEWSLTIQTLQAVVDIGANVVVSSLPVGDLATQFFADRGIFAAGRVAERDIARIVRIAGGRVVAAPRTATTDDLGRVAKFAEQKIGDEYFNIFEQDTSLNRPRTETIVLRGPSTHFVDEACRSVRDAIAVAKHAARDPRIVPGGGACELALACALRHVTLPPRASGGVREAVRAFARALEIVPRTICDNAGLDSTDVISRLRQKHVQGHTTYGVSIDAPDGIADNLARGVCEPASLKQNILAAATEAATLVLSIDETVAHPQQ